MEGRGVRPHGLPSKLMHEDLIFQETLGEGQYGSVWRCVDRTTGEVFACKQMNKKKHPKSVDRETNCFVRVQSHRNVVRLEQLYENEDDIFFLMECCTGGDLLPIICKSGGLDERTSSGILFQLLEAVQHCHERGVIHRDIKPENVLLDAPTLGSFPTIKLADFGLATLLKKGKLAQGWVGSPPYEAPEVVDLKPYDFSADIWSVGVVMYGMLSANWPSFLQGRKFNKRIDFQAPVWQTVSDEAKSLILRMLASDPADRPTAMQALEDPWFAMFAPEELLATRTISMEEDYSAYTTTLNAPPLVCQPPAPKDTSLPVPVPDPRYCASQAKGSCPSPPTPAPLVVNKNGSFVHWLDPEDPPSGGGHGKGQQQEAPPSLELQGTEPWNHPGFSCKRGSMSGITTPPPEVVPCSDTSTDSSGSAGSSGSSGPASPGSKGTECSSPSGGKGELSITRQIGRKLLQMVSVTFAANPMCNHIIPSVSTGYKAPLSPGYKAPVLGKQQRARADIQRPSTPLM